MKSAPPSMNGKTIRISIEESGGEGPRCHFAEFRRKCAAWLDKREATRSRSFYFGSIHQKKSVKK